MLLENCHNSDFQDPCQQAKSCPSTGVCPYTMWRVSGDIGPTFQSMLANIHYTIQWQGKDPLSRHVKGWLMQSWQTK